MAATRPAGKAGSKAAGKTAWKAPEGYGPGKALTKNTLMLAATGLVLVAGAHLRFAVPATSEAEQARQQIAAAQAQLASVQQRIDAVNAGGKDSLSIMFERARKADGVLPSTIDKIGLVQNLPVLARRAGLTVVSFTPGSTTPPASADGLTSETFQAQLTGNAAQLEAFVTALAGYEQLLTLTHMTLQTAEGSQIANPTFNLQVTVNAWGTNTPPLGGNPSAETGTPIPGTTPPIPGTIPSNPAVNPDGQPFTPVTPSG